jgi:hypothetical protein
MHQAELLGLPKRLVGKRQRRQSLSNSIEYAPWHQ